MKYGYSRLHKPATAIVLTLGVLTACYQVAWKADWQSDVENGRNYTVTSLVDPQGNLLVGGSSTVAIEQDEEGNDIVHYQPTLLKYSANGTLQWAFHFDNGQRRTTARPAASAYRLHDYPGGAEFQHLVTDATGNIYAAGIVPGLNYGSNTNDYDVAVFGLSPDGTLLWHHVIEQPSLDTTLAFGLSQSGTLLLGVHHYGRLVSSPPESTSVLALHAGDGSILWRRDHTSTVAGNWWGDTALYAREEAWPINQAHAVTSATRIAITQLNANDSENIHVYDEEGSLVWQQVAAAATTTPDVGISCSGHITTGNRITGLAFSGDDLIVARSTFAASCGLMAALLSLESFDSNGQLNWETAVADPHDPASSEYDAEFNDFIEGRTSWFTPSYFRAMFSDAHLKVTGDTIFLATTGVSSYISPRIPHYYDYVHLTLNTLTGAFSTAGETRWLKALTHPPTIIDNDGDGQMDTAHSKWLTVSGLTLNSAGKPVIALNELSTEGHAYYLSDLYDTELQAVAGKLVEFDPVTGKKDSFGTEADFLVRSVAANQNRGVFKTGDSFGYLAGFKYIFSSGVEDAPANIHIGHYRSR